MCCRPLPLEFERITLSLKLSTLLMSQIRVLVVPFVAPTYGVMHIWRNIPFKPPVYYCLGLFETFIQDPTDMNFTYALLLDPEFGLLDGAVPHCPLRIYKA